MAKDPKDRQLIELKDTIRELNNKINSLIVLLEAANKREEEHIKREKILQEQIDFLTKKLFGKSSEKRNNDIEGQMNLFNEAEVEKKKPDPAEEEFVTVEKHTRKKKSTKAERFANIPKQKVYLDVDEDKRVCERCGTPLERIGASFSTTFLPTLSILPHKYLSNLFPTPTGTAYCRCSSFPACTAITVS